MPVSHTDCTPYLSLTLFRIAQGAGNKELLVQLRDKIDQLLRASAASEGSSVSLNRKTRKKDTVPGLPAGTEIAWIHYEEKRSPSWYAADDLQDTHNQLVVLCRKGDLVALCFSDAAMRNTIVREISKGTKKPLNALKRLSRREVEAAFVEDRVRTLWLSGAHRRSVIKPDAKVLSGLELESALDPLGDQSYYFSSVRSTSSNELLAGNGRPAVIGASPQHARVWVGPTRSWDEFAQRLGAIIDQAATANGADGGSPIPVLAQSVDTIAGVEKPYDMALIVPELTSPDAQGQDDEERWLQQFSDAAHFEIEAADGSPNFEADVFWGDERLGRLKYEFEVRDSGSVRLKIGKVDWSEEGEHQKDLLRICRNPDYLTIYFDTGHTYARGGFYQTSFRDMPFTDWRWVKMPSERVDVRQEKPLDGRRFAVESIGNDDDTSLFGLVVSSWPGLEVPGVQTGWLVCDDGAMESADFIHLNDAADPPVLTLIHAKGSHSAGEDRGVSVSDYEVVVGQAVKNLRHVDRGLLAQKLAANSEGQLRDAVWRDGVRQQDRNEFLGILNSVGSNMERRVVVLQPRLRQTVHNRIRTEMAGGNINAEVRRMQQLDTLLLGARAECFALGASFTVIGEDDA